MTDRLHQALHRSTAVARILVLAGLLNLAACSDAGTEIESADQTPPTETSTNTVKAAVTTVTVPVTEEQLPNRGCVGTVAGLPADDFLGLSIAEGKQLAEKLGYTFDVSGQDGSCVLNSASVDPNRVRVSVHDDIIVAARRI